MKGIIFAFALSILNMACAQKSNELAPKDFQTKVKQTANAVVIDVRTPEEYQEGHLDKAVNKNVFDQNFTSYCSTLDKKKIYFVYCKGGKRSHSAAEQMRGQGLQVFELQGGIDNWESTGLPIIK